jgi:hypothetical protein
VQAGFGTTSSLCHNRLGGCYNYEVTLQGKAPAQAVPEPSVMLGLLGVAGMFGVQCQRKKVQA